MEQHQFESAGKIFEVVGERHRCLICERTFTPKQVPPTRLHSVIRIVKTQSRENAPLIRILVDQLLFSQSQEQGLPCTASHPSRRISGTMTSAAAGSAHLMCQTAFSNNPNNAINER
jgi:hypothetical protein